MDRELDDLVAILSPLLRALGALEFVARHLHPPALPHVLAALEDPSPPLRAVEGRLSGWPDALSPVRTALETATTEVLATWDGLVEAVETGDDPTVAWRALRRLPRAQEALWPLASAVAPVNRYFLDTRGRADDELQSRLGEAVDDSAISHVGNVYGERGGYSLYLPEARDPALPAPLIMALHGGSGHGRSFLWTWLPAARAAGAVLVAPTSMGGTWNLHGEDVDTPNLRRIFDEVSDRRQLDPERLLLTGMSDGGTFAYLTGLQADSPFTHLAPVSAAFHPILVALADPGRLKGRPIHIIHGRLDWMFPAHAAREAKASLETAGARVTYREIADLSHTYPREANTDLLDWLAGG